MFIQVENVIKLEEKTRVFNIKILKFIYFYKQNTRFYNYLALSVYNMTRSEGYLKAKNIKITYSGLINFVI